VPLGWHASAVTSREISLWYELRRADNLAATQAIALESMRPETEVVVRSMLRSNS